MDEACEAAFERFTQSFAILRGHIAEMDAVARDLVQVPPVIDEVHMGVARELVKLEDGVHRMRADWPETRLDALWQILEFFQHATIGRITVLELMDIVRREAIATN